MPDSRILGDLNVSYDLLRRLLARGDEVSITNGRLLIVPASGVTPPQDWLREQCTALEREVLSTVGINAYRYESYSTGRYLVGQGGVKAPGVTLQLTSAIGEGNAYSVFNANLDRARGPNKGKPLPKGQFRVGTRHAFYQFWIRTGLKVPPTHKFHDYLGNLRPILLTGEAASDGRILMTALRPVTLRCGVLRGKLMPPNSPLMATQLTPNSRPFFPPNHSAETQYSKGIRLVTSTGNTNHENKVVRYTNTRDVPVDPREQSTEEWLIDFAE